MEFSNEANMIKKNIEKTKALTEDQLNVFENQIQFLKFMMKLKAIIKQVQPKELRGHLHRAHLYPTRLAARNEEPAIGALKHEMEVLLNWVMKKRDRFSEQELEDFNDELLRAWIFFSYKALKLEIKKKEIELSDLEKETLEYLKTVLNPGRKLRK